MGGFPNLNDSAASQVGDLGGRAAGNAGAPRLGRVGLRRGIWVAKGVVHGRRPACR